MRISDWSSDVCSSDLRGLTRGSCSDSGSWNQAGNGWDVGRWRRPCRARANGVAGWAEGRLAMASPAGTNGCKSAICPLASANDRRVAPEGQECRSEEHTSELQSLMRISYAVFCLKKKKKSN